MSKQAAQETQEPVKPVATQLREAFDEIQTLKADRDALAAEVKSLKDQQQVALAKIVMLQAGDQVKSMLPGTKNADGSFTLPITINPDMLPCLEAQYEGMGATGMTLEEYLRDQIILPSIEAYQGAY